MTLHSGDRISFPEHGVEILATVGVPFIGGINVTTDAGEKRAIAIDNSVCLVESAARKEVKP